MCHLRDTNIILDVITDVDILSKVNHQQSEVSCLGLFKPHDQYATLYQHYD